MLMMRAAAIALGVEIFKLLSCAAPAVWGLDQSSGFSTSVWPRLQDVNPFGHAGTLPLNTIGRVFMTEVLGQVSVLGVHRVELLRSNIGGRDLLAL